MTTSDQVFEFLLVKLRRRVATYLGWVARAESRLSWAVGASYQHGVAGETFDGITANIFAWDRWKKHLPSSL